MRSRSFPQLRADTLAAKLDLGPDVGICQACLSFVSFALGDGDPHGLRARQGALRRTLALAAVRRACSLGVADAYAALVELERNAGKSSVARSIVRRLAEELLRHTRTEMRLEALTRDRLRLAPPELN